METKVQQLTCEQTILKRAAKEQKTKLTVQLYKIKKCREENQNFIQEFEDKNKLVVTLTQVCC